MRIILVLILLTSCANTTELLDGLCYNERDGTHLCTEDNYNPQEKKWEFCKPWLEVDGEVWSNCMMIA